MGIAVLLLAIPVGICIGVVGIGGVLLPPALTWLTGLDIHAAAGTSSWSFLFTGLAGTAAYARHQAMPWRFGGWLTLGAAPAAAVGALVNGAVPATALWLVLATLTAGSGAFNLWGRPRESAGRRELSPVAAVAVGVFIGFGSALTGTGGPVLLVPVLLALGVPALTTVAAGQLVQLPLVGFATLGYAAHGSVHFGLGSLLGVLAAAGVLAGARLARRLPGRHLHRVASAALVGFGAVLFVLPFLPR
ncbi:sulfite exporter TauE/SafE family protein [Amycolatopsis eburnea]|uniref:Probable membrane transporter protein n=1 Tax=Amycolatopsis eburnea TaxID=2267691 RepID=A0A3R9FGI4_9PSEU|nr:sulfite exporter TauE/SafE family protein [Amycolatopsis eburnea]RSD09487.1 sulfite exporter TauE/SafE family protein [Amycolatopsis eburnea]